MPAPLGVAAGLVVIEGLLTVGFGISEAVHTHADRLVLGLTTTVFFVAYGVGLLFCAWGMNNLRSWARSPVLLSQLILLGLAWNLRSGETRVLAVVGAVLAVLVLVGLFHPRSIDALNRENRGDDGNDGSDSGGS